ncbi:MAG: MscL family protein [Propionibacteriaceae bacterium]|nr:MscL family protein [Propionibacteriaceae bacterium]
MKGFRDFLVRGNLLELAVAFIMGAAFSAVVKAFTDLIMGLISKVLGGAPDFSSVTVAGVNIGTFLAALVSFVLTAAVLYFGIVKPFTMVREKLHKTVAETPATPKPTELEILTQIRDMLANGKAGSVA